MQVQDYPVFGRVYQVGKDKIIAIDREDSLVKVMIPDLLGACKKSYATIAPERQKELMYDLKDVNYALIVGMLSGNIKERDLIKKFYSLYCFSGYCYEGRKGHYTDIYFTQYKDDLISLKTDKELAEKLCFKPTSEYTLLQQEQMRLSDWYKRAMFLKLKGQKNTISTLLNYYYSECFKNMAIQQKKENETVEQAYKRLIKDAEKNVRVYCKEFLL